MRKIHLAGNWKLHHIKEDVVSFAEQISKYLLQPENSNYSKKIKDGVIDLSIMPSFTLIETAALLFPKQFIQFGAQNLAASEKGAFTGEVSAAQLADLKCNYVIIGHSERRHIFGESNQILAQKLGLADIYGLHPIYCVGEQKEERLSGNAWSVVEQQLMQAGLSELKQLTIAYEPVWAIGTGINATANDANEMCQLIRKWLKGNLSEQKAQSIQILYGGSVKPDNIKQYISLEDCDGALVGGASLKADSFWQMVCAALD